MVTANSDGLGSEALTLTARQSIALANATLNGGTARQSAVSAVSQTGSITVGTVNGQAVSLNAKPAGDVSVTGIAASGDVA
ncbi:MAG TPA: hypothetical protein PKE25_13465, partial [Novosphingobium sp.]|nr:hypothetical protein [Novosphingobium sp.]